MSNAPGAEKGAPPNPRRIGQYVVDHLGAMIMATGVQYSIFAHIEQGHSSSEEIAAAADTSVRGTQALLDGLVAIGLLTVSEGRYANTPESSAYLVEGKPDYMGMWVNRISSSDDRRASRTEIPSVVKLGRVEFERDSFESPRLAMALAPEALPMAQFAAARLKFSTLPEPRVLDVGGGAGVFSAVFLRANAKARATQIDDPAVNRAAREYVARAGVADRFETIDGDFRYVDFGLESYDVAIFSHVAHLFGPEENASTFGRIRRALKTGGSLLVIDFVIDDSRSGPSMALLFHIEMMLRTATGGVWREGDYRGWLTEAGFGNVAVERSPTGVSLIIASE